MAEARLSIEDAARRLGVTPRTLHYYEEMRLIEPCDRTAGGHRLYDQAVIRRLEHILRMKEGLGYSLQEIRAILDAEETLDSLRVTYHSDITADERERILERSVELLEGIVRNIDDKLLKLNRMKASFEDRLNKVKRSRRAAAGTQRSDHQA